MKCPLGSGCAFTGFQLFREGLEEPRREAAAVARIGGKAWNVPVRETHDLASFASLEDEDGKFRAISCMEDLAGEGELPDHPLDAVKFRFRESKFLTAGKSAIPPPEAPASPWVPQASPEILDPFQIREG
jgi:hypothetical protein